MSILYVDFKKRELVTYNAHARKQTNEFESPPELNSSNIFERYDYMIERIRNRFGDNQPKQGVVYPQKMSVRGIDAYGYGCFHNSAHQYMPKKNEIWNNPMPMPCDLRAVNKFFIKNKNRVVVLGRKSDPFMWMDNKYEITKSIITLANKYNIALVINTMSDLCAHEDYLVLLKGHTIDMQLGYENSDIERRLSPGSPSRLRQDQAVIKLVQAGIDVHLKKPTVPSEDIQMKRLGGIYIDKDGTISENWRYRA